MSNFGGEKHYLKGNCNNSVARTAGTKEQSDSLGEVVLDEDVLDDNYENKKQEMIDTVNQMT